MMAITADTLKQLHESAEQALQDCSSLPALEKWRVVYLGRKGQLTTLLRGLKELPLDERRQFGPIAAHVREQLQTIYTQRQQALETQTVPSTGSAQPQTVTRLAGLPTTGHLHPLTLTLRRIQDIFRDLGFTIVEGPLVEEQRYNFDLLNMGPQHPARAETDTFYVSTGDILRTHVSPLQVRGVLENNLTPPYKIFYAGRVFRAERTDATHETTFYQFEFMVVNETATIADLKGTIEAVYSRFFNKAVQVRLRPSYFPFVEPGYEIDLQCVFCAGKGCRVCKHTGWIEMAGSGMVHPQVLRNINVDPETHQGFACGAALDRLAMLYYNVPDIRLFWSGDLRFLKQFP